MGQDPDERSGNKPEAGFSILHIFSARAWKHVASYIFHCSCDKHGKPKILTACWPLGSSHFGAEEVLGLLAHLLLFSSTFLHKQLATYLEMRLKSVHQKLVQKDIFQKKTELQII